MHYLSQRPVLREHQPLAHVGRDKVLLQLSLHATITRRCVQKVGLPTYAAYTQNFENCEQQKRQPQGVPVLQIRRFLHVVELLTTTQ